MKKIIICDLDGTLANCEHRQHHVQGEGKKNWKAFFSNMYDDVIQSDLNEVLQSLHQHYDVWFVSARPDNYRKVTERWLTDAGGWQLGDNNGTRLIMRKAGDFRADTIVKKEILDQIRSEDVYILMAFDDRKSVVDMWRENGVFTAQVQDHDF